MHIPVADNRERHLIDSAISLFAQKGFNAVTTTEIIKMSGVSKQTFYHYFNNKQQLLDSILEYLWQKMADQMIDLAENKTLDPLEKIDVLIDNTIALFSKSPQLALVFFNEHNPVLRGANDSLNAHYINYLKAFSSIFNAGVKGKYIDGQIDGRAFLLFIFGGLMNTLNEWALQPDHFPIDKLQDSLKHQIKHGILKW